VKLENEFPPRHRAENDGLMRLLGAVVGFETRNSREGNVRLIGGFWG